MVHRRRLPEQHITDLRTRQVNAPHAHPYLGTERVTLALQTITLTLNEQ